MLRAVERRNKLGTVTFNNSKNEVLCYDNCNTCIKSISSKGFAVAINNGKISSELLMKIAILVLPGIRDHFEVDEIVCLQKYIKQGGRLLVTDYCGKSSNINIFLNLFGIEFRNDSLFRTQRAKNYNHPCESLISDGVVNTAMYIMAAGGDCYSDIPIEEKFPILYPYGCTLNVKRPSSVLFSSGSVCFPFHRPTCAFFRDLCTDGRIVAVGSTLLFSDAYINKERNLRFFNLVLKLLTDENVLLNTVDIECPDVADYAQIPCISGLSNNPFCCLLTTGEFLPEQEISVFRKRDTLSKFDCRHLVKVLDAFKEMDMEREDLTIIKPKFESPLPAVVPALISPRFRDFPVPPLELMDLDYFFMSLPSRLSQLTFKCEDDDLEYYIKEFGNLINLPQNASSKCILHYICKELSVAKKNKLCF